MFDKEVRDFCKAAGWRRRGYTKAFLRDSFETQGILDHRRALQRLGEVAFLFANYCEEGEAEKELARVGSKLSAFGWTVYPVPPWYCFEHTGCCCGIAIKGSSLR